MSDRAAPDPTVLDQATGDALERGRASSDAPRFQVLAIDGGGLKGIFAASALAQLEADYGTSLTDHFDLIAGTSTGGLIAIGLAAGLSAAEITDFYLEHQDVIFPPRRTSSLRRLTKPYDRAPLVAALEGLFGTRTLEECEVRLAITSFDMTTNDVYVFRTPHLPHLRRDLRERLVDVACATSAAPTFFGAFDLRGNRLIDGGVWANNPSMVGIVEGSTCCETGLSGVHLLNVGTTSELRALPRKLDNAGLLRWAPHITGTVLQGQALAAFNHSRLLLGKDRAHRMDVTVPAGAHRLDKVDARDLMGRAAAGSRHQSPSLAHLFDHRAPPYRQGTVQA